ncbi:MAG: 2-C-methyl-D-erythritol 4-phosphate cytidylyltransferase [Bacteroidales bacterium]|nr:2-C-methyl-D-erythritol 4-phosphate cytidylyltransferase [Bacteroidales bacterium]
MEKFVIIVAGGMGSRIGTDLPKQFLLLDGKPVLMHSLEAFADYCPTIEQVISIHPAFIDKWHSLCKEFFFNIPHRVVPGGETRFHSVRNGLNTISGDGLVAVHDAARPLISKLLIKRLFDEAEQFSNAIPCIPVNETVRRIQNGMVSLVDRTELRLIQTPEVFSVALIRKAYEQEYQPSFTDDASLLEAMGIQPHLIEGEYQNLKITLPGDIQIAEIYLRELKQQD